MFLFANLEVSNSSLDFEGQVEVIYSIDENKSYVNIYENVNYLHADVIDGWYDKNKVINFLPKKYDLVFVDGPLGEGNRSGILGNLEIFNDETIFIFHDTYRD